MRRPAAAGAVCRLACTLAVQLGLPLGLYLAFHSARCAPDITRWFLFNFGAMGFAALSELIAVTNIGGLAFDAAVLYVLSAATQFGLAIWCAARALPWGRKGGERETRASAESGSLVLITAFALQTQPHPLPSDNKGQRA